MNYDCIFVLCSASEAVKQIFSIEHRGKKEYNKLVQKELINRIRRHQYDENTAETRSTLEIYILIYILFMKQLILVNR